MMADNPTYSAPPYPTPGSDDMKRDAGAFPPQASAPGLGSAGGGGGGPVPVALVVHDAGVVHDPEVQAGEDARLLARAKKRFPLEALMFAGSVFFAVANLAATYLLIEELARMVARANALSDAQAPSSTLVALSTGALATHAYWEVCDAAHFASAKYG